MENNIILKPEYVEEGIPVSLSIPKEKVGNAKSITITGPTKIEIPLKEIGRDLFQVQFALYQAGTYHITFEGVNQQLVVHPKSSLPFLSEFGALASTVIFILGGLILWNMQRKKKNEAGFS